MSRKNVLHLYRTYDTDFLRFFPLLKIFLGFIVKGLLGSDTGLPRFYLDGTDLLTIFA